MTAHVLSCSDINRTGTVHVLEKLCLNLVMVCQQGFAVIRELKIVDTSSKEVNQQQILS